MQNLTMCHFTPGDQINDPRQTIIIQILYSALSYLWRRPFPSIILKRRESSVVVVSQVLNMIWNNFQEDFSPKSSLMSSYKRIVRMKTVETWEYLPPSQLRISWRHILTLPKKYRRLSQTRIMKAKERPVTNLSSLLFLSFIFTCICICISFWEFVFFLYLLFCSYIFTWITILSEALKCMQKKFRHFKIF